MTRRVRLDPQSLAEVFNPRADIVCTDVFSKLLEEYKSNWDYFLFVVDLVASVDSARVKSSEALLPMENDSEQIAKYKFNIANPDVKLNELKAHRPIFSHSLVNGIVHAFQFYFSGIIVRVMEKRPEILNSSESLKVSEVLQFTKHRDLVQYLVRKKVNDLSYGGLSGMEEYFKKQMSIDMFRTSRQRQLLKFFFEVRNINIHNRGVVNDVFRSRVGKISGFDYHFGKPLTLSFDDTAVLTRNAIEVALFIDKAVSSKFKLQQKSHGKWSSRRNT